MHRSNNLSERPLLANRPVPRLGIIGGGQLAKMTATAAASLGCEIVVLERQEDFPAQSVDTHFLKGDWNDPRVILRLAPLVDVVTLENEFVDVRALGALSDNRHQLWPSARTMTLVQDKLSQKQFFSAAGIRVARFSGVSTPDDVEGFGLPAVLKKRFNSYDGKGNAMVNSRSSLDEAWTRLGGEEGRLFAEEFCRFERELAIIVTRGQDGSMVRYPVVETVNREHVCHLVKAPASIPSGTAHLVCEYAGRAVEAIDGVGSFGLEFFLLPDGSVLLNEIAPRVHNTGHYTIEACTCSQFENHVRAVLGWPLGSPQMVAPAAVMVNLLGYSDGPGTPRGLEEALSFEGAHVHIYGKSTSARGRKMGHVTGLGQKMAEAEALAQKAADCIRFGGDE